jgi:hypothetical protein
VLGGYENIEINQEYILIINNYNVKFCDKKFNYLRSQRVVLENDKKEGNFEDSITTTILFIRYTITTTLNLLCS